MPAGGGEAGLVQEVFRAGQNSCSRIRSSEATTYLLAVLAKPGIVSAAGWLVVKLFTGSAEFTRA